MSSETDNRTAYEIKRGLVSRKELRGNVLELMDDLSDESFHDLYGLIWSMSSSQMLLRMTIADRDKLTKELKLRDDKQ